MQVDWQGAIVVAVIVVGLLQYLKKFFPKETDTRFWAGVNAAICVGISAALWATGAVTIVGAILLAGLSLAISQLAYEVIVQGIPNLVSSVLGGVTPPKVQPWRG